ncbi:MAG: class I SAM-dependent methyltransferase [Bacteroidia bacterium]
MIKRLFGDKRSFDLPTVNHEGKEFEVNNWLISEFVVQKLVPIVGYHPFPLNELMLMASAVSYFKPEYIFEWGTNIGKSARIFYEITETFKIKSEIHSIDLPDDVFHNEHPQKNRGIMVKGLKRVTLHQADGIQKSLEIIKEKNAYDKALFFVDGDHSYESVKKELEAILKAVPNAKVLLHDTFYQTEESKYNIGPFKAINEVLSSYKDEYKKISTIGGLPGMTLVYRK